MRSLYESLLDDENDLINNKSIEEHLIKKWFEENSNFLVQNCQLKVNGNDVEVIGNLTFNNKTNFRSPILKKFHFKKITGKFTITGMNKKKNYWLPEEISGDFIMLLCNMESLNDIPFPKKITEDIQIIACHKLKNLNGLPDKVKNLLLKELDILNLDGCSKEITEDLIITGCNILSFKGFPNKVKNLKMKLYTSRKHINKFKQLIKNKLEKVLGSNIEKYITGSAMIATHMWSDDYEKIEI